MVSSNTCLLQSPWGVAGGAIAGLALATFIAVLGGAFLAKYISEKLVIKKHNSLSAITNFGNYQFYLLVLIFETCYLESGWLHWWCFVSSFLQ